MNHSMASTTKRHLFHIHALGMGCKGYNLRKKGFTLIELLVVLVIVGILAGLGIVSLNSSSRKINIDNQARRIHADLSEVKVMAMTKGRTHFFSLNTNGYTAYDDTNESGALNTGSDVIAVSSNQALNLNTVTNQQFLPITWSGSAQMDFNSRGICSTSDTVCIYSTVNPRYDCINISPTRIALGKLAVQGVCSAANCQIQ